MVLRRRVRTVEADCLAMHHRFTTPLCWDLVGGVCVRMLT